MEQMQNQVDAFFVGTILEDGYGYIPRNIMRDKTLHRNSKAIYAYFMSFAGNKMTAFPSVKTICTELGFGSEDTYYKYLNQLKERGLLSSKLIKNDKGKFEQNLFTITLHKSNLEAVKESNVKIAHERREKRKIEPLPKNQGTDEPLPKNRDTENEDAENRGTNINNTNINNTNNLEEEETLDKVLKIYYESISKNITLYENKLLNKFKTDYGEELLIKAIYMAVMKNAKNLQYIQVVLEDWFNKGLTTAEEVNVYLKNWLTKNNQAKNNREQTVKRRAASKDNYNKPKTNFADYDQREYDYVDLEKKLLGWDN